MLVFTSCNSGANDNPLSRCTSDTIADVVVFYGMKNYTLTSDELIGFYTLLDNFTEVTRESTLLDSDGDDFWNLEIRLKDKTFLILDFCSPYIIVDDNLYTVDADASQSLQNYIQNIVDTTLK